MASETDKVVKEIDVYSCRNLWGNTTKVLALFDRIQHAAIAIPYTSQRRKLIMLVMQLCLFQYPLRPLWRPYEVDDTSTVSTFPLSSHILSPPTGILSYQHAVRGCGFLSTTPVLKSSQWTQKERACSRLLGREGGSKARTYASPI